MHSMNADRVDAEICRLRTRRAVTWAQRHLKRGDLDAAYTWLLIAQTHLKANTP